MSDPAEKIIRQLVASSQTPSELTARVSRSLGEGQLFLAYKIAGDIKGASWLAGHSSSPSESKPSAAQATATQTLQHVQRPTNVVLAIGALAVLALLICPPYVTFIDSNTQMNAGFFGLFSPPNKLSHVNAALLGALILGVSSLTAMVWALVRSFESDA